MTLGLALALLLLTALLTLVSYVERLYTEMGKFLSREFEENIEAYEQQVEPRLRASRERTANSMAVLEQLLTGAIALIIGYVTFSSSWTGADLTQAIITVIMAVAIFNRFLPYLLFVRTNGRWLSTFTPVLSMLVYVAVPVTVLLGFAQSVVSLTTEEKKEQEEEVSPEAVEAFIEAGEEEGILEEGDRELIHSVVEFGDKTVRDVMTPRPEITVVPLDATVEQFTELLRQKPYSRVPVYEGTIDQIRGLVFAHDVIQVPDSEAAQRTVGSLMRPVNFVPESKKVAQLLREMQRENIHIAMVIDEYGSVAGVVTIEDLVEEIVGEIRDEHEARADIVPEEGNRYIVPGNMDVDRLAQLFGFRPDTEATTVGGLVSEYLGRIPAQGEIIEEEGLRFEVLESTDRRVDRLRVGPAGAPATQMRA